MNLTEVTDLLTPHIPDVLAHTLAICFFVGQFVPGEREALKAVSAALGVHIDTTTHEGEIIAIYAIHAADVERAKRVAALLIADCFAYHTTDGLENLGSMLLRHKQQTSWP